MKPKSHAVFAFYKPKWNDFVGQGIAMWTRINPYTGKRYKGDLVCHVERIFSNGQSFSSQEKKYPDGSPKGVRFKRIEYSSPERWIFMRVPIWEDEYIQLERANSIIGKDYDWNGILFHEFIPFNIEEKEKFFCSESCMYSAMHSIWKDLGVKEITIDPNLMKYEMEKLIIPDIYGGYIENFDINKIKEYTSV